MVWYYMAGCEAETGIKDPAQETEVMVVPTSVIINRLHARHSLTASFINVYFLYTT